MTCTFLHVLCWGFRRSSPSLDVFDLCLEIENVMVCVDPDDSGLYGPGCGCGLCDWRLRRLLLRMTFLCLRHSLAPRGRTCPGLPLPRAPFRIFTDFASVKGMESCHRLLRLELELELELTTFRRLQWMSFKMRNRQVPQFRPQQTSSSLGGRAVAVLEKPIGADENPPAVLCAGTETQLQRPRCM